MSDLDDERRAWLVGPEARMDGYYIGFDRTGNELINQILSAVAWAGKGAHHTDDWTNELLSGYGLVPKGGTFNDLIQDAAVARGQRKRNLISRRTKNERL